MNLLLTNDDGYTSVGLVSLANRLSEKGHNVYVVAPDSQRSAFSHAVNLHKELIIKKLDEYGGAKEAYTCSGTPSDCVKFGVCQLGVKFDAVISGPNNGENYGFAVAYSGTVGAAEEGVLCEVPSIAVSRLRWYPDGGTFGATVEYISENLEKLVSCCTESTLISVNVPDLPMDQIKGVKVCKLSLARIFNDKFVQTSDNTWKVIGDRQVIDESDTDIAYCEAGYITVTPVSVLRSNDADIQKIKRLEK